MAKPDEEKRYVDTYGAAEYLGMKHRQLVAHRIYKSGPAHEVSEDGKHVRYLLSDLDAWRDARKPKAWRRVAA